MSRLLSCLLLSCATAAPTLSIGPPIHTDTPITLGLEGRGVRSFVKVTRASEGKRQMTTTAWPVAVPFNVTARGVIGAVMPTVFRELKNGGQSTSSSGLGDVTLFAKYVAIQRDRPGETMRLTPKIGLKLPTGDDEKIPHLGSGSTDVSLGAVGAWLRGRLGIYGEGLFQRRGAVGDRNLGDGVIYNVALAYRVLPEVYRSYPARQVNSYLEFNGSWTGQDDIGRVEDPDSGAHILFIAPGLQYIPTSRMLVEASVQAPLIRSMKGTQLEPDWSVSLGLRVLAF